MTKVLVVHATPFYNGFIKDTLASLGVQVEVVLLNTASPSSIQAFNPDIIILDINENHNTAEMCKSIRFLSTVPLLVISVAAIPKVIASILDSGADDYLVKPVSKDLLHARINTLVRRKIVHSFHAV